MTTTGWTVRPSTVTWAIWLFGATQALGVLTVVVWPPPAIGIAIVTFAILIGLLIAVARRRNWARILMLVLYILGLPFALMIMPNQFGTSLVLGIIQISQLLLQAASLLLLFVPASRPWFVRRSSDHSTASPGAAA